jgi:hypothetical protein
MICAACYRDAPPGSAYCPRCGARLAADHAAAPAVSPEGSLSGTAQWTNPWEERGGRGAVGAFAETLQQTLFRPTALFRGTAPDTGAGAALWYAVIVGTFSVGVAVLWQHALGERFVWEVGGKHLDLLDHRSALAGLSLLLPVGIVLLNLVHAAFLHVALVILGGARGTYGTTLKAVCYSWSAMAFNVFPVCGAAVGTIWQVVVQVIGLRELHRTSTARAFWAWFLPFVVAFCLAGVMVGATLLGLVRFWEQFVGARFEV